MSLTPLLEADPAISIHAFAAIAALLVGAIVLWGPKGTPVHRGLGYLWAGLMLVTATSAWFISEIRLIGPFSPIHLFSLLTYAGLAQGIYHARRRDIRAHRASMVSLYVLALMLTGAFTLLPGRRMHAVLFGPDAGWPPSLVAIGVIAVLGIWVYRRLGPGRRRAA